MSIATDVRAYADTALEQSKTVLSQATATISSANKRLIEDALPAAFRTSTVSSPAFAVVGAADLVAETVTKRVEALPAEAAASVAKAQENSKAAIAKAQSEALAKIVDLRGKFDARVESTKGLRNVDLQGATKDATEAYLSTAKNVYDTLTARGEAKVSELRNDPRLVKFLGDVSYAADAVQSKVSPVVETVQARVSPVVDTVQATVDSVQAQVQPLVDTVLNTVKSVNPVKPAAAKAPVRKAPAAKAAPAKKAPARKAPAAKPSNSA